MMHDPDWQAEIVELHNFFMAWLAGDLVKNMDSFARCAGTMAEGFAIITPAGGLIEREALLAALYSAHGSRPGLRIWIEQPVLRRREGKLTLVTYEEWQEEQGRTTARRSTVLFRDDPQASQGLSWVHVHETWMASN
ncbi:MAG: DUF4440 domain-containing protein [Oscillochloris sp.]|nr:DUF4440 domain-containing protein [Oscillochloris sp.]